MADDSIYDLLDLGIASYDLLTASSSLLFGLPAVVNLAYG